MRMVRVFLPDREIAQTDILSFTLDNVTPQAAEAALGAQGIVVRAGLHCASWAHEFTATRQLGGTVRVSVSAMNSVSDIQGLVAQINLLQSGP
jgi:selenocysteine lyase/cysteine desulfurase